MITEEPKNWKDLQEKVNYILNGVGLNSEKEVILKTPRGSVEIDVYAIDECSVDKIKYIVECKNWNNKIPQTVIHSFITIMNETGGNIGFVISKKGFQKGAIEYTNSTNIRLFSFNQFQIHYFEKWYLNNFSTKIYEIGKYLILYLDPLNSRRYRAEKQFSILKNEKFNELFDKYSLFGNLLLIISSPFEYINIFTKEKKQILSLDVIKKAVLESLNINIESNDFQNLILEFENIINKCTNEFNEIFEKNIFIDL